MSGSGSSSSSSKGHHYPVPLNQRRAVPAYALAWGPKVDYPAPGLVTPELAQNIAIDSIFINFTPSPTPTSNTYIRELIIPDKCEECRLRAKGCDRARPLCGRCRKIGKACVPVSSGFARLRKGRGGKAAVGYGRIWGQSEDPEEVEREEREREKREKEAKYKEVVTREAPPTPVASSSTSVAGPSGMPLGSVLPIVPVGLSMPNKKRKRTMSTALGNQASLAPLPPAKGHYVDYSSFNHAYASLASTSVQSAAPPTTPAKQDPNNIPIDPQLLHLTVDTDGPGPKRVKTISSPLSVSTGPSTGPSTGTSAGSSGSLSLLTHHSRSSQSYPFPSPSTPYNLAGLSLSTPASSAPPSVAADILSPVDRDESMTPIDAPSPLESPPSGGDVEAEPVSLEGDPLAPSVPA